MYLELQETARVTSHSHTVFLLIFLKRICDQLYFDAVSKAS